MRPLLLCGLLVVCVVTLGIVSKLQLGGERGSVDSSRAPIPADSWKPETPNAQTETSPNSEVASLPERRVTVLTNVGGAVVTLQLHVAGPDFSTRDIQTVADVDGTANFEIGPVSRHTYRVMAEARAPGYSTETTKVLNGRATIQLRKGVEAMGTVVDHDGAPVEGATVLILKSSKARTNSAGVFRAFIEAPRAYRLLISHPRFINRVTTIELPAENIILPLDSGLKLSGRVTLASGAPIAGCQVMGGGGEAVTDSDGRYELRGLGPRAFRIHCNLLEKTRLVTAGTSGVDFVVHDAVLRVKIEDEQFRPVHGAGIVIDAARPGDEDGGAIMKVKNLIGSEILYPIPENATPEVLVTAAGYETATWKSRYPQALGSLTEARITLTPKKPIEQWSLTVTSACGSSPRVVIVRGFDSRARFVSSQTLNVSEGTAIRVDAPSDDIVELSVLDASNPALETVWWRTQIGVHGELTSQYTAVIPAGSRLIVNTRIRTARWWIESPNGLQIPVAFRTSVPFDEIDESMDGRISLVSISRVPIGRYRLRSSARGALGADIPFTVEGAPDDVEIRVE